MILGELFVQMGVVIVAAAVLSFVVHRLRQPLIIAYILTGILIGPSLLSVPTHGDFFSTLSDIGVAFLLFTVGLDLDWKRIREVGWVALAVGVGQVVFTSSIGYFLARTLGFTNVISLYIGVAFTFSSTIIIVKLLSDKEHLDRLYGRISVGFLIVQDLIAMFLLLFISALGTGASLEAIVGMALVKWAVSIAGIMIVSTWIIPRVIAYASRSQELLFLFGLAWCFGLASLLSLFGFGIEVGALFAGISLAGTVWSKELIGRMRPLRDFFLIIFFVLLGTQLTFAHVDALAIPVIVFSLFILIGNPIIVLVILRALGYHPRTGFMAGTTVAQVSEFSFILLAAGIKVGQIPASTLTLATLVGLITITVSSYLITYNEHIYNFIAPVFRFLEPATLTKFAGKPEMRMPDVVLFGYHRMGEVILPKINALHRPYVVVDFDPMMVERMKEHRVPYFYGDAGDEDFLQEIKLEQAKLIISTIPDEGVSHQLVDYLRRKKFKGSVVVTVRTADEAARLYKAGATFVIVPSVLGAERFGELLGKGRFNKRGTFLTKAF